MEIIGITKGDWTCNPDSESTSTYFLNSEFNNKPTLSESIYNARLIENAPKLLELLNKMQGRLDLLIQLTPSGDKRNQLTDENIEALELIYKISSKINL